MLTEKEVLILKLLCENARMTTTEISRKSSLPRSTVNDKIRKFRRTGLISGFSCLLDFNLLNLPIQVKILFKIRSGDRATFEQRLLNSKHANNIIKLGNEFHYLTSFAFESMDSLHKFLDSLVCEQYALDYQILYVAKELKREGFLL